MVELIQRQYGSARSCVRVDALDQFVEVSVRGQGWLYNKFLDIVQVVNHHALRQEVLDTLCVVPLSVVPSSGDTGVSYVRTDSASISCMCPGQ
jgi:hypothetical protein